MVAAGLWLGPSVALAQNAAQPATNSPTPETIGPRELQGFSLNGTVTRSAETPSPAPRPPTRQPPLPSGAAVTSRATLPSPQGPARSAPRIAPPPVTTAGRTLSTDLPPVSAGSATLAGAAPEPGFSSGAEIAPAALAPAQKASLWPWLLLAAVVGGGAAFLLWRRRSREAVAGGAEFDLRRELEPQPRPETPPPPPPTATPVGIISTRLRPWIDIAFVPLGCIVDDQNISVEFEVQIRNSGTAPARDILVEASMFNASATQEQDLGNFFGKPIGQGERIEALPPLQSVTIRTALVAPRKNIQLFELAGRQVFVPIVAFNALYRWGGGRGQTAVSYLLGRETKSDRLGPLRADLGPRTFTGLAVKPLATGLRK
jgi:hypothetical protein